MNTAAKRGKRGRLLAPRLAACNIVGHTPGAEPNATGVTKYKGADNEHGLFECAAGIVKPGTLNAPARGCMNSMEVQIMLLITILKMD